MATHSIILAWRIPGREEPSGLPSMGSTELDMTESTWQQQQQTTVEVMKIMATSFKRFHAGNAALSASNPFIYVCIYIYIYINNIIRINMINITNYSNNTT